ncbi:MAG: 1-deoxy-D-xylulose-5-phosphate synthase [Thermoanaerobaculia bacterium]
MTRLLESIESPHDLRKLDRRQLPQVAQEIRDQIIEVVSNLGGHFGGNLGCVELTLALHYVFDTPRDQLVWDTGHQSYPHKLITGRRDRFHTIRQHDGISGFCKREESVYDVFNAGHASTSISAALGIAVARDFRKEDYRVMAVIGDGALSGGMALEGLNQAGHLKRRLFLVLNDNDLSISNNVGAISGYLNQIIKGQRYNKLKDLAKGVMERIPLVGNKLQDFAGDVEELAKHMIVPGLLFEELGFKYLGPYDGHNLDLLIDTFEKYKDYEGPIILHVITKKGKGYVPAEDRPIWSHGVNPFDPKSGEVIKAKPAPPSYTAVFAEALVEMAKHDEKIVALTAAMPEGTGLDKFEKEFPERFFDVGIAEEHAVTFCGGMATQGMKPVAAIYSTFLQRAFDQVFHDVAIMDLPVVFALDRAGIAGADGPTHHGIFDMAYLRVFPNMICMAPKDENELRHMVKTAFETGHPTSIRYPRGNGFGVERDPELMSLPVGKGEVMRDGGKHATIFAIGIEVWPAVEATKILEKEGIDVAVINARFIKPIDEELVLRFCKPGAKILTVEEGSLAGGFGSAVMEKVQELGIEDVSFHRIGIPDVYVHHGSQDILRAQHDLHTEGIAERLRRFLAGKVEHQVPKAV